MTEPNATEPIDWMAELTKMWEDEQSTTAQVQAIALATLANAFDRLAFVAESFLIWQTNHKFLPRDEEAEASKNGD